VFFEVLLRLDILTHPMENCDGGFEAATIGGFADWFAVLCFMKFHLCPQAYKHYSQKQRKTDRRNSRFNKWLSPNVIAEKLDEVDLAKISRLHPATQTSTAWDSFDSEDSIKIQTIRQSNICEYLTKILKEQVASIDLASSRNLVGKQLKMAIIIIWELIIESYSAQ
jgi:uncharacterized membrane-anchored protein YjiN (DUF445 family)